MRLKHVTLPNRKENFLRAHFGSECTYTQRGPMKRRNSQHGLIFSELCGGPNRLRSSDLGVWMVSFGVQAKLFIFKYILGEISNTVSLDPQYMGISARSILSLRPETSSLWVHVSISCETMPPEQIRKLITYLTSPSQLFAVFFYFLLPFSIQVF
jgi:hypothetical protein